MINITGRFKVAIWGATEAIWGCITEEINFFQTEIVTFIDSDPFKNNLIFHNIPIIASDEVQAECIDYILIAAYSGMKVIRKYMEENGIPKGKIVPFISRGILSYNVGDLTDTAWEASLKLYVEPEKMGGILRRYLVQYEKYVAMQPFDKGKIYWNTGKHLISHACGGYVKGIPQMYSNSKEALGYTLSNEFDLMECDVCRMPDGEWMLAHSWRELYEAWEYDYTPLSLNGLLLALSKEKITCLIDIKWENHEDYAEFVQDIDRLLKENYSEELKKRIVLEAYDEETIKTAITVGYQVFYTQYRNSEEENYMKTALLCEKYNVKVVGFGVEYMLTNLKKHIQIFTDKGIDIYVFSTDKPEEYAEIRRMGGYGVFTNYMRLM